MNARKLHIKGGDLRLLVTPWTARGAHTNDEKALEDPNVTPTLVDNASLTSFPTQQRVKDASPQQMSAERINRSIAQGIAQQDLAPHVQGGGAERNVAAHGLLGHGTDALREAVQRPQVAQRGDVLPISSAVNIHLLGLPSKAPSSRTTFPGICRIPLLSTPKATSTHVTNEQ